MDYETIKKLARQNKCSVKNLIVLSPSNDPFYCGSEDERKKAEWFADTLRKFNIDPPFHVRRIHYAILNQAMKPDGTPYQNTLNDWALLCIASKYARYLGLVPDTDFVDRRNPEATINAKWRGHESFFEQLKEIKLSPKNIADELVYQISPYNPQLTQKYMVEIWVEKSTMNDILEPICSNYNVNLVTGIGELSITAVRLLIERILNSGKQTIIIYISDFDPSGENMPVSISRKIEFYKYKKGIETDIRLIPLVLTPEQCIKYNLPRTPIKSKHRQKGIFEERYGAGATELDSLEALHPGEFKKIVESFVSEYVDGEAYNKVVEENERLRGIVRRKIIRLLKNVNIKEIKIPESRTKFKIPEGEDAEESRDWLFESNLPYLDQLTKYKKFKTRTIKRRRGK